jgi:dihydroorotate dehydrogenase electron transfer subunit
MTDAVVTVLSNRTVARGISLIEFGIPDDVHPLPGQFLHVSAGEAFLRRPISFAGRDEALGTARMIVRSVGRGSTAISSLSPGERVRALLPLGNPFPVDKVLNCLETGGAVWLAGGGVGVAPLLFLAEVVRRKGLKIDSFVGFGDEHSVFGTDELEESGKVSVSIGGVVTDAVAGAMKTALPDFVITCGPRPMLRELQRICAEKRVPGYVSLEERMGCGIGACLVCACETAADDGARGYRRVCRDGPVFDMLEVCL